MMNSTNRVLADPRCVARALREARAQEWTRFRGPNGYGRQRFEGRSRDLDREGLPLAGRRSPARATPARLLGRQDLPRRAPSNEGKERMLLCLKKADGKELWSKKVPLATNAKHKLNSVSRRARRPWTRTASTPASSPRSSFCVKAWDHSGKEALDRRPRAPSKSQHGHGSSPVLFEEQVDRLPTTRTARASSSALDAKTGKSVWKCPRGAATRTTAYGTPTHPGAEGRADPDPHLELAHGISSLDLKTGAPLVGGEGLRQARRRPRRSWRATS